MDVLKAFKKLAGSGAKPRPRLRETEWPEAVYAVGDVHGCLDLLRKIEARIVDHASRRGIASYWVVTLGDLVDRGPDSASVLDHLLDEPPEGVRRIALAGNHEEMMLEFLEAPNPDHRWLRFGGQQTLESYGVEVEALWRPELGARERAEMLQGMIPASHIDALRTMPALLTLPGVVLVHAGIFQGVPLEQQSDKELLWMRHTAGPQDEDETLPLVVHGHTPSALPFVSRNRICIDTGAYSTGVLTALCLMVGKPPALLQVKS